jgi:4-amino-4-deoxy-L-arabinose transferase-like glycosyltransferase
MKWDLKKVVAVVISIIVLVIVRLHDYDRMPTPGHAEELLYGWSGIYLIEEKVPQSWSTLDYPKENLVFDGIVGDKNNMYLPAKLYRPWLDEPPLYSLLSGGAAHLMHADRTKVLPPSYIRIPSVLASIATMMLVFWVGLDFFGFSVAMLALWFYGTSPIMVFGSRLSVPENIIALGAIALLLLAKKYLKSPGRWFGWTAGIMSAVLGLMKPTGFFVAPLAIFLAAKKKRWTDVIVIAVLTLLGIFAFIMYGRYFGWDIFKRIIEIQGVRFAGWTGLSYILTSPAYDIVEFYDGWYLLALIFALFFSIKKNNSKEIKLLNLFFFFWLLVGLFGGTEQDLLPWYRYPLFPLLALYGGLGIQYVYKKINFQGVALVLGLALTSRWYLHNAFRPTTPPNTFRLVMLIALLPSLIDLAWKKPWTRKFSRLILIAALILGAFYNYKYIYSAFAIRCEAITCPFGPTTKLSEVKLPVLWRFLIPKDPTGMLDVRRPKF